MSYQVFSDDLQDLISSASKANAPNQNALAAYQNRVDPRNFETRLDELLSDLLNYAGSQDDEALYRQLNSLSKSEDRGFGTPDLGELEARARRVDRALRVYVFDSDRKNIPQQTVRESAATAEKSSTSGQVTDIFVVHGHDDAALHEVCRLISGLGLNPVVLREQPNRGATIIEKFERNSQEVGFAIILMTADDMGASLKDYQEKVVSPRARQNVIMEMGYFIAHLNRERVAVLKSDGVEEPSDIFGVVYTPIDHLGAWKLTLGQELKAAGFNVDLNKLT